MFIILCNLSDSYEKYLYCWLRMSRTLYQPLYWIPLFLNHKLSVLLFSSLNKVTLPFDLGFGMVASLQSSGWMCSICRNGVKFLYYQSFTWPHYCFIFFCRESRILLSGWSGMSFLQLQHLLFLTAMSGAWGWGKPIINFGLKMVGMDFLSITLYGLGIS